MKRTSKCENEQLDRRTLIHESSTFLCLCIVKNPQLTFCECLIHLKPLYEHLYVSVLVRVFIVTSQYSIFIYIFMYSCGDLHAQLAGIPPFMLAFKDYENVNQCRTRFSYFIIYGRAIMCGSRGVRTPLKNYKNIGFLSNTGPDPLKITKLLIQHSMLGHYRRA